MLSRRLLLPLSAAAVAACLSFPAAGYGQTIPDQPVWFTFSNPVALPGVTLQPGQYEFKLTSSKSDRNIVEVVDKSTGKRVTTAMAVPTALTNAQTPPEKPEVRFYETPAGTPPAVQSWWYPGVRGGHEFLYPKEQAQILAKTNAEGVLTTEGDLESGKVTRYKSAAEASAPPEPSSSQAAQAPAPEPVAAPAPAPAPVTPEPPAMNMQARATDNAPAARRELPQTASEMPLIAAMGVGSFFAGLALVMRRRGA